MPPPVVTAQISRSWILKMMDRKSKAASKDTPTQIVSNATPVAAETTVGAGMTVALEIIVTGEIKEADTTIGINASLETIATNALNAMIEIKETSVTLETNVIKGVSAMRPIKDNPNAKIHAALKDRQTNANLGTPARRRVYWDLLLPVHRRKTPAWQNISRTIHHLQNLREIANVPNAHHVVDQLQNRVHQQTTQQLTMMLSAPKGTHQQTVATGVADEAEVATTRMMKPAHRQRQHLRVEHVI